MGWDDGQVAQNRRLTRVRHDMYHMRHIMGRAMDTAKVFWSGRSQAVRLPKAYRVEADEMWIRRHGSKIILDPVPKDWSWLHALVRDIGGQLDEDFIKSTEEELPMQERPALDDLP